MKEPQIAIVIAKGNADHGTKRRCGSCETPFYDMQRHPISCPKCGAVFVVVVAKTRSTAASRRLRESKAKPPGAL